jgi:hypothetical protein
VRLIGTEAELVGGELVTRLGERRGLRSVAASPDLGSQGRTAVDPLIRTCAMLC